ncbi:MAG TPA: DUF5681 domain-containing protein [Myxococcota bacterium]|nr:DUF5681 domain-containing protein [Myxococcota bacterium]
MSESKTPPEADYDVGYGKPPKHTQFKPGQSGNPRGRPKGTKNLKTDLMEELGEKIVVREGEETRRVSKQRAVVKTLVAKTLKGDARAGSLLTGLMMRLLDTGEDAPGEVEPLHDDELEILAAFEARRVGRDHASARPAPSDVKGSPEEPE